MTSFRALRIDKADKGQAIALVDLDAADLMDGDVTIRVSHSTVNYKDGMAVAGRPGIVRRFPMIPGIDFSGVVETSANPDFKPGDAVVLNGWGVGETHFGGYAGLARVKGDWLVPLPKNLTAAQSMAIGTAGYTAMLAVLAIEDAGLTPADGPVVVTGAAGGVGSVAIAVLAKLGWQVIASTGRPSEHDYLKTLGAAECIDRADLSAPADRPLGKERWAAAVDSVGSMTLANVLAQTKYDGVVTAMGLAQGFDLPATVMPFILRGVSLIGINSVLCPKPRRLRAWDRLARDMDLEKLAAMTTTITLDQVIDTAQAIVKGQVRGRVVVEMG